MQKAKTYASTFFGPQVLRQVLETLDQMLEALKNTQNGESKDWREDRFGEVTLEDETWQNDNLDEFLAN